MDLDIEGNVALVTASSSGLGKASATALAREGADVVINGRSADRLEAAADDIARSASGSVHAVAADITDADACERLVAETVDTFGGVDHLVTSAGGVPPGPFEAMADDDWYDAYDMLVMSVVRTVRHAIPHLNDGGGTIVTIASRSVKEANEGLVLSNAVRMGVIGLEKTLSRELAPAVRANAVLPGPHETARIHELVDDSVERGEFESVEAGLAAWADTPLQRLGEPMELGDTVAFLSSPRAGFITGAAIPVDGGATASNL